MGIFFLRPQSFNPRRREEEEQKFISTWVRRSYRHGSVHPFTVVQVKMEIFFLSSSILQSPAEGGGGAEIYFNVGATEL